MSAQYCLVVNDHQNASGMHIFCKQVHMNEVTNVWITDTLYIPVQ